MSYFVCSVRFINIKEHEVERDIIFVLHDMAISVDRECPSACDALFRAINEIEELRERVKELEASDVAEEAA